MLEGVLTVVITTTIAVVGVLTDTKKRVGLRWTLLALIVAGSVVALIKEDNREKQVEKERERVAEEQKNAEMARLKAESERKQMTERLDTLIEQTLALYSKIDEMEDAAKAAKNEQVIALSRRAKVDSAKTILPVVKKQKLLPKPDIEKIETKLRDGPLTAKQFNAMLKSGRSR